MLLRPARPARAIRKRRARSEFERAAVALNSAVRYKVHHKQNSGSLPRGVNEEAVSSFVGRGVPTGVMFRLGALRTSYINAFGQHY